MYLGDAVLVVAEDVAPEIPPQAPPPPAESGLAPVAVDPYPNEQSYYPVVAEVLKKEWLLKKGIKDHVVEVTANKRSGGGGTWSVPDIVILGVRVFPYLPGKYLDLVSFEIKPHWAINITAIYEALAHRRSATQSYVWFHCKDLDQAQPLLESLTPEAERYGIGVLAGSDPADFNTWEEITAASRVEPDPEDLNAFIKRKLENYHERLLSWLR